jgi:hypothetical protein
MSTFPSLPPSQSLPIDELRYRATARLRTLIQKLSTGACARIEVDDLRTLIESLSPVSAGFGLATNHVRKAQRFLSSDEVGAARYELRLLLGCLDTC